MERKIQSALINSPTCIARLEKITISGFLKGKLTLLVSLNNVLKSHLINAYFNRLFIGAATGIMLLLMPFYFWQTIWGQVKNKEEKHLCVLTSYY